MPQHGASSRCANKCWNHVTPALLDPRVIQILQLILWESPSGGFHDDALKLKVIIDCTRLQSYNSATQRHLQLPFMA
jgi:hypothetical protein